MKKEANISKGMKEIATLLNSYSVEWFLSCGTLLGIYRDGRIIPWDKDVDFEIKAETFSPSAEKLAIDLKNLGYRVIKKYRDKDIRLVCIKYNYWFVLRPFKLKDSHRIMGSDRKIPAKYFDDLATISYGGFDYPCPADTEGFLEYMYGKNWRIPMKVKDSLGCVTNQYHRKGKVKV